MRTLPFGITSESFAVRQAESNRRIESALYFVDRLKAAIKVSEDLPRWAGLMGKAIKNERYQVDNAWWWDTRAKFPHYTTILQEQFDEILPNACKVRRVAEMGALGIPHDYIRISW